MPDLFARFNTKSGGIVVNTSCIILIEQVDSDNCEIHVKRDVFVRKILIEETAKSASNKLAEIIWSAS